MRIEKKVIRTLCPTLLVMYRCCDEDLISLIRQESRAPSQYPIRRLSVRSRKVSKPRDLYLELSDRSEIWQALRQHDCRCACQISKRCNNLKYQSLDFEISRDLTKRRIFVYWDGSPIAPLSVQYFESGGDSSVFPSLRHRSRGFVSVLIKNITLQTGNSQITVR